MDEQLDEEEL